MSCMCVHQIENLLLWQTRSSLFELTYKTGTQGQAVTAGNNKTFTWLPKICASWMCFR